VIQEKTCKNKHKECLNLHGTGFAAARQTQRCKRLATEKTTMITLTEKAQKAISRFIKGAETPVEGLRISVTGGGCSGMQYGLELEETAKGDDTVVELGSLKIFIDPYSAPLLKGVTVDFLDSMEGSGFKFENPNASASCGCGNSFSA
jgi:iron-sulfur cluster assembly protein